ncbi:hypothetical protein BDN72DRAFT_906689 [Pluteus cervinus]|uniref:Uncharacterized protein n=1 Tax=Pluteus cervinus TaxID=181527 RepID=A0ACD2ZYX1_9AGAR|nr:hypothetical protein BDN72DRAFT_906689 [Pluteus cervinus]
MPHDGFLPLTRASNLLTYQTPNLLFSAVPRLTNAVRCHHPPAVREHDEKQPSNIPPRPRPHLTLLAEILPMETAADPSFAHSPREHRLC